MRQQKLNHFYSSFLKSKVLEIAGTEELEILLVREGLWYKFQVVQKYLESRVNWAYMSPESSWREKTLQEMANIFAVQGASKLNIDLSNQSDIDIIKKIVVASIKVSWSKIPIETRKEFQQDLYALRDTEGYAEYIGPLLEVLETKTPVSQKIEAVEKKPTILTNECFVIMPFTGKYGGVYENIFKPAILQAKLVPYRADESPTSMQFTTLIKDRIRSAKAVLAFIDVRNGKVDGKSEMFFNPNVMYEVGMAIMTQSQDSEIHRTLIYSNEPAKMPADLRHFNIQSLPMSSGHDSKTIETIKDGLLAIQAQE